MQLVFPKPNRSPGALDAIGFIGLAGLLVARFIPVARLIPWWGCTFRQVTGVPCPGCGLTRAADRLTHLNVLGALKANPLGTVAAALFGLAAVAMVVHLVFGRPLPDVVMDDAEWKRVRYVAVTLFLVNYVAVIVLHRMHLA